MHDVTVSMSRDLTRYSQSKIGSVVCDGGHFSTRSNDRITTVGDGERLVEASAERVWRRAHSREMLLRQRNNVES